MRSELAVDCPLACRPLHSIFNAVDPYVGPVYDRHVQPHIHAIQPYLIKGIDGYNTYIEPKLYLVSEKVVPPMKNAGFKFYQTYLASHEENIMRIYNDKLGIHVQKATQLATSTYYDQLEPLYEKTCRNAANVKQTFDDKYAPLIVKYSTKTIDITTKYRRIASEWVRVKVAPTVVRLYQQTVEPQLLKISTRIWPSEENHPFYSESDVINTTTTTEQSSLSTTTADSDLQKADTTISKSHESEETTVGDDSITSSPMPSTETSLSRWNVIVRDTTREAFNTFLDDVEEEKRILINQVRPQFTLILQQLSSAENEAVKSLRKLIEDIEQDSQQQLTPAAIQAEFRMYANQIREKAMDTRKLCQEFADTVINKTEEIRRSTVEVLDEFADITLQEIGRKLVSSEDENSSSSSSGGAPNWSDWKQYRSLKERLIQSREDIISHEVNMAEVNQMLREAQETANVLSKEAAQYLSGLRAKADFLIQQRLANSNNIAEDKVPDAEYYEELEDEEQTSEEKTSEEQTYDENMNQTEDNISTDEEFPGTDEEEDYYDNDEEPEHITLTSTIYETIFPEESGMVRKITHYDTQEDHIMDYSTDIPNMESDIEQNFEESEETTENEQPDDQSETEIDLEEINTKLSNEIDDDANSIQN